MKRMFFTTLCLLTVAAGAVICVLDITPKPKNPLASANVEALTEDEIDGGELPGGEITCSGTGYGTCYVFDWDLIPGAAMCNYYCRATGIPEDHCSLLTLIISTCGQYDNGQW